MTIRSIQIIIASFLFVLLFTHTVNASGNAMKIAVASTGQAKDSTISQQAGRALFFLLFDDRGNLFETIENPAKDKSRNAGPSAASFLADKGVTLVIAEDFGSKMKQVLEEHHIKYIEKTGVANNVVQTIIEAQ